MSERLRDLWNPPDRVGAARRHARVKLLGSLLIIAAMLTAIALELLA